MNRNRIKFYIKEYLTFSRGEQTGIIVLFSFIFLTVLVSLALPYLVSQRRQLNVSQFESEIANFERAWDSIKKSSYSKHEITDTFRTYVKVIKEAPKKILISIEINSADSVSLEKLPGVGPVLAHRILKYRTLLGGYYSISQLKEVYGLRQDVWSKINKLITIDTFKIKKINLNSAGFKEINAHPYISFEQAKAIFKCRKRGKIVDFSQLISNSVFTAGEMSKLKPYVLVNM